MHGDGAVVLRKCNFFAIGTLTMDSWAANTSNEKPGNGPVFQQNYWNPAIALAGIAFSGLTLWMPRARIMRSGEHAGFHLTLVLDGYFIFSRRCSSPPGAGDFAFGELRHVVAGAARAAITLCCYLHA
jgi:hypothetical protein